MAKRNDTDQTHAMARVCLPLMFASLVAASQAWAKAPAEAVSQAALEPTHPRPVPLVGPKAPWKRRRRVGVRVELHLRRDGVVASAAISPFEPSFLTHTQQVALDLTQLRELGLRPRGLGVANLQRWPHEPASPGSWDVREFSRALKRLCPVWTRAAAVDRYARWILRYSQNFLVDPALLAALIYQQSRCQARKRNSYGIGLAMINADMHRRTIVRRSYRYGVLSNSRWQTHTLPLWEFPFDAYALTRPESNIYFAAAFMSVFQRQCPHIDGSFRSIPHRHPVSHFIWGDQVRETGPEDRVLNARRRLLSYYRRKEPRPRGRFAGLPLRCPLEGAPRVVTSGLGEERDGGRRLHTGIDIDSTFGEPVVAIAPGIVIMAGVDAAKAGIRNLQPHLTRMVSPHRMGPRGLLVMVRHTGGVQSRYMHLSAYIVTQGQRVRRGQLLGYVGRTGIRQSAPHLHFELFRAGHPVDPLPLMRADLIPPRATYFGRRAFVLQDRRRRCRISPWTCRRLRQSLTGRSQSSKAKPGLHMGMQL